MLETSARLLRLLSLLQTPRDGTGEWTGTELAERLEVSTRTIRRDVDRLRDLGYPVQATMGAVGGYRLGAGVKLPPLLLDDDEAVAVAVSLRTTGGHAVAGFDETSMRALAKLEQVLPPRLRSQVNTLQAVTVTMPTTPGPTVDGETLGLLATACREQQIVRFDYTDRDGADSERRVEPLRLVSWGRRWYLVAFDLDRDDWRTFRVDRLTLQPIIGHLFAPRLVPGGDVTTFVTSRVSVPWPHVVRVRFAASAEDVAPGISPSDGIVEAIDDDSCIATLTGEDPMLLAAYLGMFCVDFLIIEPDELKIAAHRLAERFTRAAR